MWWPYYNPYAYYSSWYRPYNYGYHSRPYYRNYGYWNRPYYRRYW